MTKQMTPELIAGQIAALDATLIDLERRAAELALAATEGDPVAVAELAGLRAEMEAVKGDRSFLVAARRAAQEREAAQHEALKADERAKHMGDAKAAAAVLLGHARRIDDLVAAFHAEIAALVSVQAAVRFSYRAAGEPLQDARVGRANAQAHAAFLMSRVLDGSAGARQDKSMTDLIETAWSELLEKSDA
ncbi:MAG: hypothetical protein O9248_00145 [Rhodobacteraceae bacterium]|nr:hypothetical protein [Paracoccaceae bacterium]